MGLVNRIKARLLNAIENEEIAEKTKKQYNVVIDKELIAQIRLLASACGSNRSATAEHLLEIGSFYLGNALADPQKREIVVEHLCDKHLLGIIGGTDDLGILMIGQNDNNWELLEYSKPVLRAYKEYCKAPKMTMKTGDVRYMEKAEKDLLKAAVGFAIWLQKRALGIQSNKANEQGPVNQKQDEGKD